MSSIHDRATLVSPRTRPPERPEARQDGWLTLEAYVAWLADRAGAPELALPRQPADERPEPPSSGVPSLPLARKSRRMRRFAVARARRKRTRAHGRPRSRAADVELEVEMVASST